MPERAESFFLLSRFAEFFEVLADIKQAIAEGRLAALLAVGDEPPPGEPGDLAARLSGRLAGLLHAQWKEVVRNGSAGEVKAHRLALYAMAALADELFVLEIDWAGREAWLGVLLEHKLFRSRNAAVRFFEITDELLKTRNPGALHRDLAAVLVLALQLGFKGRFRGGQGEAMLDDTRERLFRVASRNPAAHPGTPAFPQALQPLLDGGEGARLAPLAPWYTAAGIAALCYLLVSSAVWLALMEPFRQSVGAG
ncbi:DotU family type IV/VI secretion system protein [Pseudothauera nasutitermitis]|uniref:DotU family type IV/VI secretion system protein n=1 Tax=Pseudothauera nasutitermitis TaxID=2565930 RepID=A0A4S4AVT2_9RHOO|nr:DotU family type IV/VI secretion system protein [Pseudothauera nasutitermitis]THF63700.1 DotU family type IV/VI secretion system protein [Pseudothauera nasutitermitis]